jgi:hypothetical protein
MAVPTYSTDLTLIDDAQAVGNFVATGGGASALGDETDYFINDTQCVSKSGFTATTKGLMADDVSAPTITAGDAVFIWGRQANRNILDTVASGGGQFIMGTSNSAFDSFYVDGSDVDGSNLKSWVNYAVDPTATASATTGSPGAYDHFGMQWKILGSGSLKGSPNAVGVIRYGREIRCVDGQAANYATFAGAGTFDADITRRWGILTPTAAAFEFHGAFVMGQSGTAVDFRDSNRNIIVLEDAFVASTFNEFVIIHASSNVEWTKIKIAALGTTAPFILTLDVGTFTGVSCEFVGAGVSTLGAGATFTDTVWSTSGEITQGGATLTDCIIENSSAAAAMTVDDLSLITGCTFTSDGTGYAVDLGNFAATTAITWNNTDTGYAATDGSTGNETILIDVDSGQTVTINVTTGASTPTVHKTGTGTVVVNASASITLTGLVAGSRVQIQDMTNTIELFNETEATTTFSDSVAFTSDITIRIRVALSSTAPFYKLFETTDTLTSAGFSLKVNQQLDE